MQSIDLIQTYAYGTSKDLVNEKEEIKSSNIIKRYKKWFALMVLQKKTENIIQIGHNFPDHPYKTLIIGGSESGKTNSLFNLISQPQILIKFIYTIKVHMKQNINSWSTKDKVLYRLKAF